jgi:hypothetical protein
MSKCIICDTEYKSKNKDQEAKNYNHFLCSEKCSREYCKISYWNNSIKQFCVYTSKLNAIRKENGVKVLLEEDIKKYI